MALGVGRMATGRDQGEGLGKGVGAGLLIVKEQGKVWTCWGKGLGKVLLIVRVRGRVGFYCRGLGWGAQVTLLLRPCL